MENSAKNNCAVCSREYTGEPNGFCCRGCAAVHEIIENMGLHGEEKDEQVEKFLKVVFPEEKPVDENYKEKENSEFHEEKFMIRGMVCPACSWIVHHALDNMKGIKKINVNFISETCSISFDPMALGLDDIKTRISHLGYGLKSIDDDGDDVGLYRFGLGWFFSVNAMMLSFVVYSSETWSIPVTMKWISSLLLLFFGTLTPLYSARGTLIKGFRQITGLQFHMESLVSIAAMSAWLFSVYSLFHGNFSSLYFEVVCLILMIIETGNVITGSFYGKIRNRIHNLKSFIPRKVRITSSACELYKMIDELKPGEEYIVKMDEAVAVDGVLTGPGEFDFSMISGESMGVFLDSGQKVGAGARLISESVKIKVDDNGVSSFVNTILESVISAFNTGREKISTGDRIAQKFVPAVLILALSGFLYHLHAGSSSMALQVLMSVLIISCPCSFGIAEPLVLTLGAMKLNSSGVQIINGNALGNVPDVIIFDKTGTLTAGKLKVDNIYWFIDENQESLNVLSSLENGIQHPVARSLVHLGKGVDITGRRVGLTTVYGSYKGRAYKSGKPDIYPGLVLPAGSSGKTLVAFGDEDLCHMIISLKDEIREESISVIENIREDVFISKVPELVICSGDKKEVVDEIAGNLGIENIYSEMSIEDKKDLIKSMKGKGKTVMMVGDGINDASALVEADFGLAVLSGQLPAQLSADGIILTPKISGVLKLLKYQKLIKRKITVNYFWSFLYNTIGIGIALTGMLTPVVCALGMVLSNIVVLINSMTGYRE